MGLYDRPYMRQGPHGGGFAPMRMGLPRPGRVIGRLIVINIIALVLQQFFRDAMLDWFAVKPALWWQPWRYLTFQFLHGGMWHLFFNMLGLYFLGMALETTWGGRRFLTFYLVCGTFAGLCHVVMTFLLPGQRLDIPLVGASGGVYGVVLACAILFPHIRVFVFLFVLPIRVAAALFLGIAAFNVLAGIAAARRGMPRASGGIADAAHLGGALAAAMWIWLAPRVRRYRPAARGAGRWQRKLDAQRHQTEQIDRILEKIRQEGIRSLSWKEKRTLREASRRQREEEKDALE